jgi:NTE family protein
MGAMTASVAVVLGAGGVVGAAWIAGSLTAVADATGFDARDADLLIGTSAGASVAATLRQGFSPADHLAQMVGEPLSEQGQVLAGEPHPKVLALPDPPSISLTGWRPQAPLMAVRTMGRLRDRRPGVALSGLAPAGSVPHRLVGDPIRARQTQPWPDEATWLCAVCLSDGALTVFGRDPSPTPDLATAVEASVAIPGYFEPVEIDGRRYIDGGAHSVTNAELVAGLGFDLVVVIAPMTAVPSAVRPPSRQVVRAFHARILGQEVRAIRRSGTPVIVLQPTAADLAAIGPSLQASAAAPAARQARTSALARLALPDVAEASEILVSARRPGPPAVASAS